MSAIPSVEAPGFSELGFTAFTTIREAGSFGLGDGPPGEDSGLRWSGLLASLGPGVRGLASARQVHGDRIMVHRAGAAGWSRDEAGADGHLALERGTAVAVTVADCVPVFMAHPAGAGAVLHAGWRGTAAGILHRGVEAFRGEGLDPGDLRVHLGPAICGRCYEVGPEVHAALTGHATPRPAPIDLRAILAGQARAAGVAASVSEWCTRCHNERFYSHRAGDAGRQVGVLLARP